jgi:pimeloyl-ACP methyl ester carboxylesterase
MGVRGRFLLLAAVAAVALAGTFAETASARAPQSVTLTIAGPQQQLTACGGSHPTATVARRARAVATVRLAEPRGLRWGGRSTRLLVDRCENGAWRRVSSKGFGTRGPYRSTRTARLPLPTGTGADLRVQATVAGDKHRRAAKSPARYLRVGAGEIVDLPVAFEVENVNRTSVPCQADGRRYPIAGHLMAPRSALEKPSRTITVYLHGLEISGAYFRYRNVPGYDFQGEMAELGHASIVVDRLGHGRSGLPPGAQTCVGAQADMAHQLVDLTRAGDFRLGGARAPAFQKVALAGHSFGSFTAELAAMNFRNEDVLVLMAFAAEGLDPAVLADIAPRGEAGTCFSGSGMEKRPGAPGGYAYLWPDADTWERDTFFNGEPRIVEDSSRDLRERSPCGELTSSLSAGGTEPGQYSQVTVPVLLMFARQDRVFPPPAGERHRSMFGGSSDVTLHEFDNAGHTLFLQRNAADFRRKLSDWLKARGY